MLPEETNCTFLNLLKENKFDNKCIIKDKSYEKCPVLKPFIDIIHEIHSKK